MSSCSTIHLTLPQWGGSSRSIRFIYLVNLTSFRLTECPYKAPLIPLYLGADVFSSTDIRTENHPRYHAKFAKKGLATKIIFSSAFRFHGLKVPTANNSLWFYSVQGLFRVAFELYSKQDQLAVLENFQDVWKSQINDSPLKMSYKLSVQLDCAVPRSSSLCDAESKNQKLQSQRCQVGSVSDVYVSEAGQWLGQQFQAANTSISQKVEGFKVQHIERISDLPPAEELVTELFPEAMRTLLLHWMGLSEESTLEKRHSEYPILLLILEFANHNLIT
ncbi:hypothetical protein INR49_015511, partial [Caranx melampygus]